MDTLISFIEHNEALWWIIGVTFAALFVMFPAHCWQKKQGWYEGTHK